MPEKPVIIPEEQRRFAVEVVQTLREHGHEAYWAGGCVRDQLLGIVPKDYDTATDATPQQIRKIFGYKRTLPIGAAFGVITVLGSKKTGMVEVATFREDADYSDGRHPDHVTFSSAKEDASRRDFTINGLFYDPIEHRVIDYVDGQEDLRRRVLRAIGDADSRFAEDKLRMLRAVRFAATFQFAIDGQTLQAIGAMADQISVVSAERIAMEMRRMLVDANRVCAVRLLLETGLAGTVLPEIVAVDSTELDHTLTTLGQLAEPGFPLALATLLHRLVDTDDAVEACRRWRLSNKEMQRVAWLVDHRTTLEDAVSQPWSQLQPVLIDEGIDDLLALHEIATSAGPVDVAVCREHLRQPPEQLDPVPLLNGGDLMKHGIQAGPAFRPLLQRIRDAQLDGLIHTKPEALALVDRLV